MFRIFRINCFKNHFCNIIRAYPFIGILLAFSKKKITNFSYSPLKFLKLLSFKLIQYSQNFVFTTPGFIDTQRIPVFNFVCV